MLNLKEVREKLARETGKPEEEVGMLLTKLASAATEFHSKALANELVTFQEVTSKHDLPEVNFVLNFILMNHATSTLNYVFKDANPKTMEEWWKLARKDFTDNARTAKKTSKER